MDIYLILLIMLLIIFGAWTSSAFFGAPFQPSSNREIEKMIEVSGINEWPRKKKLKMAELGSGNGKVAIAFAKICKSRGIDAEIQGFEINPFLAWFSRKRIKSLGLQNIVSIQTKNFWNQDFSDFNMITSFQINYAMPGLEKKFQKELKPKTKIISNAWKFPNWKPKQQVKTGMSDVYLYVKE